MRRVVVVGPCGSGKTTVARSIAGRADLPCTDLDELFWRPGWSMAPVDEFRAAVADVAAGERWVVAGNYTTTIRDLLWPRADTLVWLDLPRTLTMARVVRRTVEDLVRRREVFTGCWQTPRVVRQTRLLPVAWEQSATFRARYPELLADDAAAHLLAVRLRSAGHVREWLDGCA